jgi:hypothetical protein
MADKSSVSSSDSPKSDISMIDNNYETESIETGEKSTNKEMTKKTHGRG